MLRTQLAWVGRNDGVAPESICFPSSLQRSQFDSAPLMPSICERSGYSGPAEISVQCLTPSGQILISLKLKDTQTFFSGFFPAYQP